MALQRSKESPLVRLCRNGWSETLATTETNPEGRLVASGTISLAFD